MKLPSIFEYMPDQVHHLLKMAAFDLSTANKVLQVAKSKIVKPGRNYSFAPGLPTAIKDDKHLRNALISHGASSTAAQGMVGAPFSPLGVDRIVAPRRGDAAQALRAHPLPGVRQAAGAVRSPEDHRLLDAIVKGHELAESQVDPALAFRQYKHRSPDVILREHNMVTSLPQNAGAVRGVLQARRNEGGEAAVLARHGIAYGESPRLSRHARKHLTSAIEKEYEPTIRGVAATLKTASSKREPSTIGRVAKVVGTGLAGFGVGSLAGAGGAYLLDRGHEALTGQKVPLGVLHRAAPVLGGAAGVAYNLYKAKELEELRRALENKSDRPEGRIPPE